MVIVIFLLLSVQASVHSGWRRAVYDETFVAEVSTDSKKQKKEKENGLKPTFSFSLLFFSSTAVVVFFFSFLYETCRAKHVSQGTRLSNDVNSIDPFQRVSL